MQRMRLPKLRGRGKSPTKNFIRKRKRLASEVMLTAVDTGDGPPTLRFKRKWPKITWMVPPIQTPLYWFDDVMFGKRLIATVGDVFVCDGRRFRMIGADRMKLGYGYTRWLVYEESDLLPNGGKP